MASLGSLGSLVVSLGLDSAEFTRGLTRAEFQAQRFAQNLDKSIALGARAAGLALVGLGTAAVAAVAAIDNLSKSAANFKDLEEKTGASAEGLASLAVAAAVGGTSMETLASASIKLTKAMTGVDDESKAAGAALTALGIPIKEFKTLDPTAQFEAVSKALAKFADGSGKTAVALALFGKSGAEILPFLKELESSGGRQVILTQKQIELADEYADRQTRVRTELSLYAQVAATQTLPAITALISAGTDLIKELIGLDTAANKLRDNNAIGDFAEGGVRVLAILIDQVDAFVRAFQAVGTVIGATAAQAEALSRFDFKGYKTIQEAAKSDLDAIISRQSLVGRLEERLERQRKIAVGERLISSSNEDRLDRLARKPSLNFSGADKPDKPLRKAKFGADDLAKAELQGRIKEFENVIREEQDILRARENFLQGYYRDDQLGIREYFGKRQEIILDALAKEKDVFDKQIQDLKAFTGDKDAIAILKSSTTDPAELARIDSFAGKASAKERIDVENKIADVVAKRAKAQQDASLKSVGLFIEESRAAEQFRDKLESISLQLIAMRGDTVTATAAGFDSQNRDLQKRIDAETRSEDEQSRRLAALTQRKLDDLRLLTIQQAQLSDSQQRFGTILDEIGIKQARIDLARRTGSITSLEALTQESAANQERIGKLTEVANAYEQIAIAIGDPRALNAAEQMKLKIEELAASADLLAQKFNDIFSNALADGLTSIATGVGSFTDRVKNAVKDMEKSIVRSISNIASQNIAESLFGKTGALGGVGGFFSSLFGGAKGAAGSAVSGAAGATVADTALTALGTSATTATTAFTAVVTAAESAAAALARVAVPSAINTTASPGIDAVAASATAANDSLFDLSTTAASATASFTAADQSISAMSSAGTNLATTVFSAIATAATTAATALASLAASSTASAAGGFTELLGGFIGTFAHGGNPPVNRASMVGEEGPELFVPRVAGTIIPNDRIGGTTNNVYHINVPAGTSRASADQIAAATARKVQRAARIL